MGEKFLKKKKKQTPTWCFGKLLQYELVPLGDRQCLLPPGTDSKKDK